MGLESMSAITSFLNQSQKQQGRRRINHVLLQDNRGSRPFSDIYIKGFPVCTLCGFLILLLLYSLMKTAGLRVFWRSCFASEFLCMRCCVIQ